MECNDPVCRDPHCSEPCRERDTFWKEQEQKCNCYANERCSVCTLEDNTYELEC